MTLQNSENGSNFLCKRQNNISNDCCKKCLILLCNPVASYGPKNKIQMHMHACT